MVDGEDVFESVLTRIANMTMLLEHLTSLQSNGHDTVWVAHVCLLLFCYLKGKHLYI